MKDFIVGFSKEEKEKILAHLERLFPHLQENKFTIVGGLAIRYHAISHGITYPPRPFNDLDIIVENAHVVAPSVAVDFLIYHYHPKDYFLALVDLMSTTKVDIFQSNLVSYEALTVLINDKKIKIASIEDQLVKTVFDIQRISPEKKVDPKQFFDTRLLMRIADMQKADLLWRKNNFVKYPSSIKDAIQRAEDIASNHPKWVQEKPFIKQKPYQCLYCKNTDEFPITPMQKIYEILGYVE